MDYFSLEICLKNLLTDSSKSLCVFHTSQCFPGGSDGKEFTFNVDDLGDHWVGKIAWRRAWQPTAVFFPGESHGQRATAYGVAKNQTQLSDQAKYNHHSHLRRKVSHWDDCVLSKCMNSNEERNVYVYYMPVTVLDKQEIGRCNKMQTLLLRSL